MSQDMAGSERLLLNKNRILEIWEQKSRKNIDGAKDKDSHTVRDELTHFLSALVENLRAGHTNVSEKERISAQHHGQQRAGLVGYTLMETVAEYGLLRKTLVTTLLETGGLTENERETIHESIDNAVKLASNEFAEAEQARIKLALSKAETSNRDLEQFAAVAAHDLRSPLTSIAGFTEVLKDEFAEHASAEARDCMAYIDKAVKRMTGLIDGILSYAKLASCEEQMKLLCADDPVNAAMQNLKGALTESSGRISHEKLPFVVGDLPLLTQLFQNLFANAIRYDNGKPPEIEVSSVLDGDMVKFCVKDNGIGFDMKYRDVIFEVHKQLDTNHRLEGAGLGLATCRRVVELHGGKIWAESTQGHGSTFYFTIPKATSSAVNFHL